MNLKVKNKDKGQLRVFFFFFFLRWDKVAIVSAVKQTESKSQNKNGFKEN